MDNTRFKMSGFSDEISPNFSEQIEGLRALGISYMEIRGVDGENISKLSIEKVREIKARLDDAGIRVSSLGSPAGKTPITDDFSFEQKQFDDLLQKAKILEAPYMRIFSFYTKEPEVHRDEVLRRFLWFAERAEGSGVRMLHENEKGIFGDIPERCAWLLKEAGGKVGAVFDAANFIQCGAKPWPDAHDIMAPYIEYYHVKDANEQGIIRAPGEGIADYASIIAYLLKNQYSGFVSMEPHLSDFVGLSGLESEENKDIKMFTDGKEAFDYAYLSLKKIIEEEKNYG